MKLMRYLTARWQVAGFALRHSEMGASVSAVFVGRTRPSQDCGLRVQRAYLSSLIRWHIGALARALAPRQRTASSRPTP
jgi:hypothetical protein